MCVMMCSYIPYASTTVGDCDISQMTTTTIQWVDMMMSSIPSQVVVRSYLAIIIIFTTLKQQRDLLDDTSLRVMHFSI